MPEKSNIIRFDYKERILQKARAYIASAEKFLDDRENALPLLISALSVADRRLKHSIILMLGSFPRQEVVTPLYDVMSDTDENETLRRAASIQLNVVAAFLDDSRALKARLMEDIRSLDPQVRANAAFALGWEGNVDAAAPLRGLLSDVDEEVRQTAVNALANIGDEKLLDVLIEALNVASLDQKRVVLYNLWRFSSSKDTVIRIYKEYLTHEDDELRMDALVAFGSVANPSEHLDIYVRCLCDANYRIRELALDRLSRLSEKNAALVREQISSCVKDPHPKIRQQAIRILKRFQWT